MADTEAQEREDLSEVLGDKEGPARLLIRYLMRDAFTAQDIKSISAVCERYSRDKEVAVESTGDGAALKLVDYFKIDPAILGGEELESSEFNPSA